MTPDSLGALAVTRRPSRSHHSVHYPTNGIVLVAFITVWRERKRGRRGKRERDFACYPPDLARRWERRCRRRSLCERHREVLTHRDITGTTPSGHRCCVSRGERTDTHSFTGDPSFNHPDTHAPLSNGRVYLDTPRLGYARLQSGSARLGSAQRDYRQLTWHADRMTRFQVRAREAGDVPSEAENAHRVPEVIPCAGAPLDEPSCLFLFPAPTSHSIPSSLLVIRCGRCRVTAPTRHAWFGSISIEIAALFSCTVHAERQNKALMWQVLQSAYKQTAVLCTSACLGPAL
ncbi:unnamed protein product [Pleuronectes platessa]|uniref:Uncharacterized protein n=1 Tax=Pleuronectes platessa TaxID=8262 RepID=A0A9N7UYL5_PLEPL|nr:unnamed protein product [Pleuronectes platessa]